MKYVTRTIETVKAKVKIINNEGIVTERECLVLTCDLIKELKKEYPNSKIEIYEGVNEKNKYRISYEDFVKYGELVK